jgi:hypothetical protein
MVDLFTPASFNHRPRVEKINNIGIPAEKPRNSNETTFG